ncbi:hypothetical protein Ahy_B05g077635 isoform D [Arachis hypogaea]|uniref:Uncharacterized protein n=1 Tax=Arachis hypogaea TaxID=3818 RepID=A0A444Z558_ARAHY|nr:hypothetical protein Ahy_B05g077635 isoform D [Arachis hypogaea]
MRSLLCWGESSREIKDVQVQAGAKGTESMNWDAMPPYKYAFEAYPNPNQRAHFKSMVICSLFGTLFKRTYRLRPTAKLFKRGKR